MRSVWCWFLPVIVGCSGQNVVAGEEKTKQEQLAESLPVWCRQYCETLSACNEDGPCECTGSPCSCTNLDVEECAGMCEKELRSYTLGDESCAALGQAFKGCLERLSCSELFASGGNDCEPTKSERAVCPADEDDAPMAELPTSVGGSTSTAGSATYGTAGSAYGLPGQGGASSTGGSTTGGTSPAGSGPILMEPVTCTDRHTGRDASDEPGAVVCDELWSNCSDGHEYSWLCARGTNGQIGCSCFVDGQFLRGFAPEPGTCPSLGEVSSACGFQLTQ